ncbi:7TM-DISM domain-containing protein [Marinobacter sp. S0848L]|uniref:7TMR-DISMED2 domain-containing protein n=1 Tax=Marinobacter sp. S0848L TaxID=2926423 RepID=UPI001FF3B967|nr:7TM-DISM domain-containing protein [Marinobacter sp. S0848L]MCK0106699.1 hypothetical protein [Marinobacter sp. S0848L]
MSNGRYVVRAILFILLYLTSPIALSGPVAFQWLAVPYDELTLEDVRSTPATEWHTVSAEDTFNHGFSDKDYWLKVSLPVDKRNRLLVIGYPLLDEVSVYWTVAGQLIETHHTGDKLPFSSRPIVHRNFVFLVPASTEPLTAWVRAHTDGLAGGAIIRQPPLINAQFLSLYRPGPRKMTAKAVNKKKPCSSSDQPPLLLSESS